MSMKWLIDEIIVWQNYLLTTWPVKEMTKWQNDPIDEMTS